jgi:leucyl/phenylalanyl-tRNA---protein transferase
MNKKHIPSEDEFLQPENMIKLYSRGAFPMADEDGRIEWYFPDVRTIIPLDNYNMPRSLRKFMQQSDFRFTFDSEYESVIRNCANRNKTWISEKLILAYKKLYEIKNLHSIEVWQGSNLVGGLYGVSYKGAFFGESMFSKISQASKAALMVLIQHLIEKHFILLDVQYLTPHLKMFGAVEISFYEYYELLLKSYKIDCEF